MGGKIFINYRHSEDSGATAARLRERLGTDFGRDRIFMDVSDIPVGMDFKAHLNSQLAECDVILVVIGSKWLRAKEKARLNQPDDVLANEIAVALERNIPVIPVLVDGARIPNESDLPDALKPLASRHAVDVRNAYLESDAGVLIAKMCEAVPALLDVGEPPQTEAPAPLGHPKSIFVLGRELLETTISKLRSGQLQGGSWVFGLLIAFVILLFLWIFDGDVPKSVIDSSLDGIATAGRAVVTKANELHLRLPKRW
jgi:hypothetical protein